MVNEILLWPPILWTVRVVSLIVLAGAGLSSILLFARFFRPAHVRTMWNARLPRVSELGGEVAGNKLAIKLDHEQDGQLAAIQDKLADLQRVQGLHANVVGRLALEADREKKRNAGLTE